MAALLMKHAFRPSVIRNLLETWRYPNQLGGDLPSAEVLSIAVSEPARGKGIGKALMHAALDEFRRRGIDRVKVAVGDTNQTANAFYRRCGYHLAAEREHHGLGMNIYVISL